MGDVGGEPCGVRVRGADDGEQSAIAKRWRGGLVAAETLGDDFGPGNATVRDDARELTLDLFLEPGETALAHHEFEARLVPVSPVAVLVEDAHHGFALLQQVLFGDEIVEELRFDGEWTEPTAYGHAEAAAAVADGGAEADIVDGAGYAIAAAATIESEFEFAREVAGEVLAQECEGQALGVRANVEDFVVGDAGQGAGGDVADGVVAGFAIGHADIGQQVHEAGDVGERYEVILDVLAGSKVRSAAGEFVGDAGELAGLGSGEKPAGDLATHHLDAGLALPVDAVLEAERAEFVLGDLAGQELRGARAEGLDFFADSAIMLNFELLGVGLDLRGSGRHSHHFIDRESMYQYYIEITGVTGRMQGGMVLNL